jgi:hypothetical protein
VASLKDEVRSAIDCDTATWEITPINPTGPAFEPYWDSACDAPLHERICYAIRRCADGLVVGTSRRAFLRRDRLTWTGYIRDTVYFSILAEEWPECRAQLVTRLEDATREP